MTEIEKKNRHMAELLKTLPEEVQDRIGYIIIGAKLISAQDAVQPATATP